MGTFGKRGAILAAIVAGTASQQAEAGSFYLPDQSVRAMGRAGSGEAADQGPASLWWNPAAIGGTTRITGTAGVVPIFANLKPRDRGTLIVRPGQPAAPVDGDARPRNPAKFGVAPSIGLAAPITDRLAVGLAVGSPYSFITDYAGDSWTRYIADRTRITTIDIHPSVAFALTPELRIGAAANVEYTSAKLVKALPNLLPTLPDGSQALAGKGWDAGWSVGGQYVGERVSIGLTYKSRVKHHLDGTVTVSGLLGPLAATNTRFDTSATFSTPWQAIGSIRFRATDRLTLNVQATRFGWGKFDRVRLSIPPGAFVPEDFRNSWTVAGGADYALSDALTVRGGVYRDQTPTQNGLRDPNVPDANRTTAALGATQRLGPSLLLDLAVEYIAFDRSSIDRQTIAFEGTPVATPVLTNGYLAHSRAINFGVGVRFEL